MVAQGTYNELLKTHLALLTTMEAEEAREADEVDDQIAEESTAKEAEAISKEMKAREEVTRSHTLNDSKPVHTNLLFSLTRSSKKIGKRRTNSEQLESSHITVIFPLVPGFSVFC